MTRTIVIGDLHGCYNEAIELLEKCNVTNEDRVIFTGDLVDRGPDSDKCVDLAIDREKIQDKKAAILGNHEEKHLFYKQCEELNQDLQVNISTHIATRKQLKDHHYDYLKTLPLYIRLPEYNAIVVHAGVFPNRTIEMQDKRHLLHIQMIAPFNSDSETKWPSKVPKNSNWKFWTNFWNGPERIIFGHSVLNKPLITDKVCGIDGGACFGLALHALILPSWEIITVNSRNNYGKGKRGRSAEDICEFLIHEDVCTFS